METKLTEIIASLQEGGISLFCSTQLQALSNVGANCSCNDLYHSEVKPSPPGDLFAFNLEIADSNSSIVISATKFSFCSSVMEGKSREARNDSI